ncbi:MAG: histidine kinase [Deinococcales bacterium]
MINFLALIFLILITANFFSRSLLLEPIDGLLKASRKVAEGQFVTVAFYDDSELGALAETFNEMSNSLDLKTKELLASNEALRESERLLEARVQQRTEQLQAVLELSTSIALTLDLADLLKHIFGKLKTVVSFDEASLFLLKQDKLDLLYYHGPADQASFQSLWHLKDIGEAREVIESRRTVSIPQVSENHSPDFRHFVLSYVGGQPLTMASWLGVPLIVRDKLWGMLALEHSEANSYDATNCELALAFAAQVALALENNRLYREAQENAALEERRHLARELHDSVSQALFGITLGIDTAIKQAQKNPEKVLDPLNYVKNLAQGGLAEMRALIFELRPESLEQEGLKTALSKQAEALKSRHNLNIHFKAEEPALNFEAKQALYRIAQEALHNVVKHAQASKVDIELRADAKEVTLSIRDNGIGFDIKNFPGV